MFRRLLSWLFGEDRPKTLGDCPELAAEFRKKMEACQLAMMLVDTAKKFDSPDSRIRPALLRQANEVLVAAGYPSSDALLEE